MTKKQRNRSLLIWMFAILIAGCGVNQRNIKEAGTWKDGIYTETAKGKYAPFAVTVSIENGFLSQITVGDHQETPEKGGAAIRELPSEMIKQQSYDVDAVSGATITSNGRKNAVE